MVTAVQLTAVQGDERSRASLSIGVAELTGDSGELTHALAAAESACKAAKDRGRNRAEAYLAADESVVRRFTDITIAASLRGAVAEDRLRLDAQFILPLDVLHGNPPHFELLLRMIDDDGATVGPDRFLSAANRYQLMPTIDRWVIHHALAQLRPHTATIAATRAVFAINFSGQSLNDAEFADELIACIEASGLPPQSLCFELTESATIANLARAEVLMRRLRKLGCGVALDDFGTGLSSLAYLRQLPVSMLKIDGSFVRDIQNDPRSESLVQAVAQLARTMQMVTVAEYVETDAIRERIAALGVDYGQGFSIGRPVPLTEVLVDLPAALDRVPRLTHQPAGDPAPSLH
jgi:EAL domain-containing protein (putative c-di-GMP-specific phosphodiesterase class I)